VRVDVNIAGYSGGRVGEGGAAVTSVLLPVAPRRLALDVISRLLPGVEVDSIPFAVGSRRMIWVRPITWRSIGYGITDTVFVARRGVLRREIDIIAHGKTQSVRLTQGPLQRKLRLATVHIDTTPGPVLGPRAHWDAAERCGSSMGSRGEPGPAAAQPLLIGG
jgi:putative membrane protein